MYKDGREVANTREGVPRDKSRLQFCPQDTSRPGETLEKGALSGQPATHPEPSPHSILTPQVTARSRALQVTARLRTQPKSSQKFHGPKILEKVDLADRCCKSVNPSVIKEPEPLPEEHTTLADFQREVSGERRKGANTQAQRSADKGEKYDSISEEVSSGNCRKK